MRRIATPPLVSALLFFCATNVYAQVETEYKSVSRCIFVYAPMHEVAKKRGDEKLTNYSLQRLLFINGYIKSRRNDQVFTRIFDSHLSENKSAGIDIEQALDQALATGDSSGYNRELKKAELCDRAIGFGRQ